MVETKKHKQAELSFERLMHLGEVAHKQGHFKEAYEFWRKAAILEPADEQVWIALMWVLDTDEDRKVCLKNILAINPENLQAQEMLDDLIGDTQADERVHAEIQAEPENYTTPLSAIILLRVIQTLAILMFIAFLYVISTIIF